MKPTFIRKRILPNEEIDISNDTLLYLHDGIIMTKWLPIKPRKDISRGFSYVDISCNYKLSLFCGEDGCFKYWYCDVIRTSFDPDENKYVFTDLLADVIYYPASEGNAPRVCVLDIDELDDAFESQLISARDRDLALDTVHLLTDMMYNDKFPPIKGEVRELLRSELGEKDFDIAFSHSDC